MQRIAFLVAALIAVTINTQGSDVPLATSNRFVHYNLHSIISTDEKPLTANVSDSIWCQAAVNDVPLPVVHSMFIRFKDPQRREFQPDVNNANHKTTLKIDPVVINNMGKYRCTIEAKYNKSNSVVASNIMVYSPPFFHTNGSMNFVVNKREVTADRRYATEGGPMEVHCPAVGYPRPTIVWYKEDELLVIDGVHISVSSDSTVLTIDEFAESDAGVYRCIATNEYPNRLDLDVKLHEASLAQEVAIGSPYGWIYPLLVILVILLLLFIIIYACEREKLLRTHSPASSAASIKKYEIVSST